MRKLLIIVLSVCLSTIVKAQVTDDERIIGTWTGPNQYTMTFDDNGTGYLNQPSMRCSILMKGWSAKSSIINLRWDTTPVECYNVYDKTNFMHTPKHAAEEIKYSITKENKEVGTIRMIQYTMTLENAKLNTKGSWVRVEMLDYD
jgi:hypothetical protein